MKSITLKSLTVLTLATGLAVSTSPALAQSGETIGTLGGAAVGGLVGNQFGKGDGNVAATIGGVLVGGVIGNAIGRDNDDYHQRRTYYNESYYAAPPAYYAEPAPVYYAPPPTTTVIYHEYPRRWHKRHRNYYRYY
jgi:phage tail tape-measure protein